MKNWDVIERGEMRRRKLRKERKLHGEDKEL